MQVFITGGTGLIGSAVVAELLGARPLRARAHALRRLRCRGRRRPAPTPIRGGLADLDVIRAGAEQSDAAIHLAFSNDFSSPEALVASIAEETAAITSIGERSSAATARSRSSPARPWIAGRASTEADPLPTDGPVGGRGRTVDGDAARSPTAACAPPRSACRARSTTNGTGGFAGLLTQIARGTGVSGYPGDGTQRWPAVHALDAAVLFRLALEQAPAGTSWHAVADEGDAVPDIATVIGRKLGLPVQPLPDDASARSARSSPPTSPPRRAPTPRGARLGSRRT